jgi:putative IMPACT (imprinted ancient) family translation regulator
MISQDDLEIFESNQHLYDMLIKHSFVRNYTKETYTELINLYSKYVNDKHNFSHWCSSCRAELVNHLYQWYQEHKPKDAAADRIVEENEIAVINSKQIQEFRKRKKK